MREIILTQGKVALVDDKDYVGVYDNEIEAAKAYDKAAVRLFKKFAFTNGVM